MTSDSHKLVFLSAETCRIVHCMFDKGIWLCLSLLGFFFCLIFKVLVWVLKSLWSNFLEMHIAYICIRERQTSLIQEIYYLFQQNVVKAKIINTGMFLTSCWNTFQVLGLPLRTNFAVHREVWLLLSWKTEFGNYRFPPWALASHLDSWEADNRRAWRQRQKFS